MSTITREPVTHNLKIWPEYYSAVCTGVKRAELRKNDRDYRAGDNLHLMETPRGSCHATGEFINVTITHVADVGEWMPGYVLLSIAPASLEAEPVAYVDPFAFHNFSVYRAGETDNKRMGREWMWANPDAGLIPVYAAPQAPVSVPDEMTMQKALSAINRLSWQECTRDAYMLGWNACRTAMLHGAKNAESRCTMKTAPALDSSPENAESRCSNSPVIPDGGEHGFCQRHQDTRRLTHPYKQLLTYPPRPSTYCPKCDPEVSEWVERDKLLRQSKPDEERPYTVVMPGGCQHEWVHHVPCSRLKPEYEECYKCGVRRPYPAAPQQEVE